jgi:nicotinamide riboside transporter PnuC
MHKKIKDLALAVALLGVSVFSLVTIGATPEQSRIASAAKLSYASLPKTYGWALVILVGIYMITVFVDIYNHWRTKKSLDRENLPAAEENLESDSPERIWPSKVVLFRLVGTLFMLITYVFSLEYVHFMLATTVFLFCMFLIFGQKSLKKVFIVSIAGGVAFYLLFIKGLNLPI